MGDTGQPPPGGGDKPNPILQSSSLGQVAGSPTWVGAGALGGVTNNRSFHQIIEEEKKTRNIIEIQLAKASPTEDSQDSPPRPLTYDDLGELIFDVLKIDPSKCISFDYNTGRYDIKHLQLKSNVQADQFVTTTPIFFKGFDVSVKKQLNNITRVTFKNVPLNVPN